MKKQLGGLLAVLIFIPASVVYAQSGKCPHDGQWDGTKCVLVGVCTLATEWNGTRCVPKGTANKKPISPQPEVANELIEEKADALEDGINIDDDVISEEEESIIDTVFSFLSDIFNKGKDKVVGNDESKIGGVVGDLVDKVTAIGEKEPKWGTDIDGDGITDFDPNEEDPFADNGLNAVKPGEYKTDTWPNEGGTKIAKIVDVYGKERYTSDGKYYYDTPYDAAHSGEGVSSLWNGAKDKWSSFWNAKNPDKEKQLRIDVAREVIDDAKSQDQKDVENAYAAYQAADFVHDAVDVARGTGNPAMFLAGVPADAIVAVAKEVSANDFSSAAAVYIREREGEKNNSPESIRKTLPELFGEGYGTLGNEGAISLVTKNKHAPAVLQARYEEAYQRYKIAKEFERK